MLRFLEMNFPEFQWQSYSYLVLSLRGSDVISGFLLLLKSASEHNCRGSLCLRTLAHTLLLILTSSFPVDSASFKLKCPKCSCYFSALVFSILPPLTPFSTFHLSASKLPILPLGPESILLLLQRVNLGRKEGKKEDSYNVAQLLVDTLNIQTYRAPITVVL